MTHPSENVRTVGLAAEFDVSGFIAVEDLKWLSDEAIAINANYSSFVLRLDRRTSDFLAWIGKGGEAGVSQQILSTLKYSKQAGFMFVILNTDKPR